MLLVILLRRLLPHDLALLRMLSLRLLISLNLKNIILTPKTFVIIIQIVSIIPTMLCS